MVAKLFGREGVIIDDDSLTQEVAIKKQKKEKRGHRLLPKVKVKNVSPPKSDFTRGHYSHFLTNSLQKKFQVPICLPGLPSSPAMSAFEFCLRLGLGLFFLSSCHTGTKSGGSNGITVILVHF